jgi:hypothetical protein
VVGNAERWHAIFDSRIDEIANTGSTVEHRVLGVGVQVYKGFRTHRFAPLPERQPMPLIELHQCHLHHTPN